MKVLKTENKLCFSCMEMHEVQIVEVEASNIYKGREVKYMATYEYCDRTNQFIENEDMLRANDIAMKNAYHKTPEDVLEENGFDPDELGEEGAMLFRDPDYTSAICGVTYNGEVVYNYEKMINYLIENEEMDYDSAADFISYNASFGMSGCKTPIIMYPIEQ